MRSTLRRADGPRGMSWTAKLQVTYHKLRLYAFIHDTGHSVTGNGVAGFHVAKVTMACTAAR